MSEDKTLGEFSGTWVGDDFEKCLAKSQEVIGYVKASDHALLIERHAELVSAVRNASKLCPRREVFDESKDREFLDAMNKLAELVK